MNNPTRQRFVIEALLHERERQDAKWGEQNHPIEWWLAILMEEVGEAAQEALLFKFAGKSRVNLRYEMVHVAAVAVAILEYLDRQEANGA